LRPIETKTSDYFRQHGNYTSFNSGSWVVLSSLEQTIKQKIEKSGVPLKEWDINIYRGILTGYNEAFIIDTATRDKLIAASPNSAEIIRPILLGKNIKRYNYQWDNNWVILVGFGTYKELKENYPAIYEHLIIYEEKLKNRGQCRYTSSGKVNTQKDYPGQHHWLELDNNPSVEFLNSFDRPKIAWGNMALNAQFSFIEAGMCINAPSVFISTDNLYLLAIMNSSLGDYYIKQLGISRNGGYIEYKPMFVEKLPIIEIGKEKQLPFIKLAEKVIDYQKKGMDTLSIESTINEMVFELYELTDEEVSIIKSQFAS
jgi:adenine-specific DNA-methyltransferase